MQWHISASRNLATGNLHYILFCSLGGLGAAYALQVHTAAHAAHADPGAAHHHPSAAPHSYEPNGAAEPPHSRLLEADEAGAGCNGNGLVALCSGFFLVASAGISLLGEDPTGDEGRAV